MNTGKGRDERRKEEGFSRELHFLFLRGMDGWM
jgi:hypothetical protein